MGKDQRGFTLVELVIAIAIMAVVIAAVCGFIVVGSRSYAEANSDIAVQQEAQLALNQMSDVVIDTTRSINYAGYNASGVPTLALKDSEFSFVPEDKALIMYNGVLKGDGTEDTGEGNGNKNYQFLWDKSAETLFYSEIPVAERSFPGIGEAGCEVLAEHVSDFSIDLSQVEEKRVVMISMTFKIKNREYTTSNNVTIRNKVKINDAEIKPLDKSTSIHVTPKKTSVILEPGETYHFSTPKVTGNNILDKSVRWSIEGKGGGDPAEGGSTDKGSAFADTENGILQIAINEEAKPFNVVITTCANGSDGNRATAMVQVRIKRATDVNMYKSSDEDAENSSLEVSAGKKFTISAEAVGQYLGTRCNGCEEDPSADKNVVAGEGADGWQVLEGAEFVTIDSAGKKDASFTVSGTAQPGAKIKIRATSWLSVEKSYGKEGSDNGFVTGIIELTVAESRGNADLVPLSGDFVYGTDNNKLFDYMYSGLSTELQNGHRVVYVRVREGSINADKANDRIAAYYSTGANVRFFPDQFGLDINKSYYILLQIIDPMPAAIRDKHPNDRLPGEYQDASTGEIRAELLNEANFDRSGKYIGTKFKAGDMYYGTLNPPNFIAEYWDNGKTKHFPNDEDDYISYSISGGGDTIMNKFGVSNLVNIFDEIKDDRDRVQFTIYKGKSKDPETWERIYGVDLSNGDPVLINGSTEDKPNNLAYSGENPFARGWISVNPQGQSNTLRMNGYSSVSQSKLDACGTYYIVPGFAYANNPHVREYEYIIEPTGNKDFGLHYYEQKYAAIPLVIRSGLTLQIIDNIKGIDGWINFPLPSSKDSLFTDTGDEKIKSGLSFSVTDERLNYKAWISGISAKCIFKSKENLYELTLYSVEMVDGKLCIHTYGVYTCRPNGQEWEWIKGASNELKQIETTLHISDALRGKYGRIEFPLPSSLNPLFDISGTEQVQRGLVYDFYNESATALNGSFTVDAKCVYDSGTGKYKLTLYEDIGVYIYGRIHVYGVYECAPDGKKWVRTGEASEVDTGERFNTEFVIGGTTYETYLYAPDDPMFAKDRWDPKGFGFTPGQAGEQTWMQLPVKVGSGVQNINFAKVSYYYNVTDGHMLALDWDNNQKSITLYWDVTSKKWQPRNP